jgi:hypothetical protein
VCVQTPTASLTPTGSVTPPGTRSSSATLSPGAVPSASATITVIPDEPSPAPSSAPRLAHGLVFGLHRDPRGATALGRGGGELGFGGLSPSFGLRFDTYSFDTPGSSLGFLSGGAVPNPYGEFLPPWPGGWGASPGYVVSFSYYPATKRVVAVVTPASASGDGSPSTNGTSSAPAIYTLEVDLPLALGCPPNADTPCDAHLGFTAATGTSAEGFATHRVLDFQYLNGAPTPSPSPSGSLTPSASASSSWTPSVPPTPSLTASNTWTASATASNTPTSSVSATGTGTSTRSSSGTPSGTATQTPSRTSSPTTTPLPSPFTDTASALAAAEAYTLATRGSGGAYDWHADPLLVSLAGAPDADYSADRGSVALAWEPFEDTASGIAAVAYCLGSAQYECDVAPWTTAPRGGLSHVDYAVVSGLNVTPGSVVYATVAAVNGVGLVSMASSDGLLLDGRLPVLGRVADTGKYFLHPQVAPGSGTPVYRPPVDINCDAAGGGVGASWGAGTSLPSGLDHYDWSVGSAPLAGDLLPWTAVGAATAVYNATLDVPPGGAYYACVRATGANGLTATRCSDGVRVLDAATAALRAVCLPPSGDATAVY